MDQKDVQIKNLNSLLAEATADSELNKLVEEAETENSVKDTGSEVVPEVKKEEVLDGEQEGKDVKVAEDDGAGKFEGEKDEEVKTLTEGNDAQEDNVDTLDEGMEDDFNIPDGDIDKTDLELPEGTLYRKGDEDTNLGIEKDDVLDTIKDGTDLELPEGVLTGKTDAEVGENNDNILGTTDSDTDIKDDDHSEPTNTDLEEGLKLPEGVITYKDSDAVAPSVEKDDVLDTLKDEKDLELPEGVLKGKSDVEVGKSNDDILGTTDSAADINDEKLNEAINKLNLAFESLSENAPSVAVKDGTDSTVPDVKTEDVLNTVSKAADIESCNKKVNDKDCDCKEAAPKKYETAQLEDLVKVKLPEYKSLKEAIELGKDYFDTDEKVEVLKEKVSVLLAKENGDLLYEELARLESQAKSIRESIEKKYSIISNNRVDTLLESMESAEQRIAANRENMFKKLTEQQELNAALSNVKPLGADEVAFGE